MDGEVDSDWFRCSSYVSVHGLRGGEEHGGAESGAVAGYTGIPDVADALAAKKRPEIEVGEDCLEEFGWEAGYGLDGVGIMCLVDFGL